ncbi:spermidine synthase [Pseudomonas sp. FW215-R2]|uniref:fused MFS/spermidine synthase n=1 Tax=unclassified Pseudomonas TaxID=196821 RepID=UPI000C8890B8|nr:MULTISPECIES: fused MFS/spermidine synthase [unclassified Pseudomonas]PMW97482.1 spermidine synthase [Pseudomonas sp. FW215-R2]PMX08254.1 spermidine synthase [Pseudomonas sp. FW215-L1]PMX21422.1 spermidine synthase [Pseudomonas sp. FW215-E1]PNA28555.1 spermidine synthase [Pseudomonas sp. FW215-R4]
MSSRVASKSSAHPLPHTAAPALLIPALLLCISGAAALVYQVLWIKQLSLLVGVEVYAITTGISAFFAGLAIGGWLFGRWADRLAQPVLLYAGLEVLVAVLGVGATFAMSVAASPFAWLQDHVGLLAWVLPFMLVGVPAVLMGGTLPVLVRSLGSAPGKGGGQLYAANTLGAIVGTLLAAFVLIATLGVRGSALAAAMLNLLAAAGALGWQRQHPMPVEAPLKHHTEKAPDRTALWLYSIAGGVALGYEVVWSQSIVQFMSTRTYAFAVVLATYLTGLFIGSALLARRVERIRDPWGVFGLLIAGAGLIALLEIALLGRWLVIAQSQAEIWLVTQGASELAGMSARFAVAALCIVFLPTLLLGAAFPLALRLSVGHEHVGRDVGAVVAFNTLGGIIGVMLCGFLLIPLLGLVRTLGLLAIIAAGIGWFAVRKGHGVKKGRRQAVAALGLLSVALAVLTPVDKLASLLPGARNGTLAFYEEGRGGTVAVVTQGRGQNAFQRLYIQGVSNTGDAMPSLRYMRIQALLPLLIHNGEPRSALVIGFGTGITAGALLRYPGLEHRVVAELLPSVIKAAPLFKGNFNAASNPGVDVRLRDGRQELLRSPQTYDLITLEPPPPSAAGVVNLYSRDFYQLAASRLEKQGLVAQWLPLPTQNIDDSRSLVRSFLDVFPYATLWTSEFHEMLLVGSLTPIELDAEKITRRLQQDSVRSTLQDVGIGSAPALLSTWVTDRAGLERFAADAPAVTDDQPRIEYAPWVRSKEITRVLPALLDQYVAPPLVNADAGFAERMQGHRQRLMQFYRASLHAYDGDRDAWGRDIREVMQGDGGNPYFRWFVGQ